MRFISVLSEEKTGLSAPVIKKATMGLDMRLYTVMRNKVSNLYVNTFALWSDALEYSGPLVSKDF